MICSLCLSQKCILVRHLAISQIHQFISISRLWSHSTFSWWRQHDDGSEKNNMTYDATLKYIIFWKVLWQRNNSSRILQELLWSQTIIKWSPKTLTKIKVTFKLSNKYLIRKKKRILRNPIVFFRQIFRKGYVIHVIIVLLTDDCYWGVLTISMVRIGKRYIFWCESWAECVFFWQERADQQIHFWWERAKQKEPFWRGRTELTV